MSLASLRARTPLRVQLVVSLLVLLAVALAVTGIATTAVLRDYLLDRVDRQLESAARPIAAGVGRLMQVRVLPEGPGVRLPSMYYVELRDTTGESIQVARASVPGEVAPPRVPGMELTEVVRRAGQPFTVDGTDGGPPWRVTVVPMADRAGSVVVAQSLDDLQSTTGRLVAIEVLIGGVVLLALAGVGYAAVRSSLRPLEEMETTAEAIADGDLSQRVAAQDPRTEVGRLGRALNGMLTQIETAFRAQESSERKARESEQRMRRFVADASHELRTPLTSISGFAELHGQGAMPGSDDVARAMRRINDEAARMGLLVDDLLLLARLDQQRPLERRPVDLLTLTVDAVHDARAIDPDRRIELTVGAPEAAPVMLGDEARLRQVVGNLMSNALAHTPAGTRIDVRLGVEAQNGTRWAVLEVADSGPGLTADQAERVFERFYRADPSRTRARGGSGLGLSIVAALVGAHGGRADVESAPGTGSTFRVRLPLGQN